MQLFTSSASIKTSGRSLMDITPHLTTAVQSSRIESGLVNVFLCHTSASLIINENADPDVLGDLERYMSDLVRDGDTRFLHTAEGSDDMSAHVRAVLTATSLSIPIRGGAVGLGTWQGLYLWEHRTHPHKRTVEFTVIGNQVS